MSHVDEGLIHAWLDGALLPGDPERVALEAHLTACDECRTRVEAARSIRDRAAGVLRTAAPDATRVEPFESMIAARRAARAAAEAAAAAATTAGAGVEPEIVPGRVEHTTPITQAPSRRRRAYVPLAWAASLLMAVTAGWFARQYLPVSELREYTLPPAAESDVIVGQSGQQVAVSAEPQAAAPGAARAIVPPFEAPAPVRATPEAAQKAKAEAETIVAGAAATTETRRPPEETRRLADAMVREETRARTQEAAAPPAPAFAAGGTPLDAETSAALASYANAQWEMVSEAEAARRLGQEPARIDGVPIDSLQATPHAGGWLVRVVQRLGPDGAAAELLQWRQAIALHELVVTGNVEQKRADDRSGVAADSALRRLERQVAVSGLAASRPATAPVRERPAVQVDRIGYRVLLRADVSPDSLRVLGGRVR